MLSYRFISVITSLFDLSYKTDPFIALFLFLSYSYMCIQMQPHSTHNDWYHWQRGSASTPLPTLPPVQSTSPSLLQSRYNPANHLYQPYARPAPHPKAARPRLTTTLWEDESTMCYQVDSRGICVARRQGNVCLHF